MYRACFLLVACVLSSCGGDDFESNMLPEVQLEPPPEEVGSGPIDRVSLALAAEDGNANLIARLHRQSDHIRWPGDGVVAVRLAARRGHTDVVELLLSYGACADSAPQCFEALHESRARDHLGAVVQLESVLCLFLSTPKWPHFAHQECPP